MYIYIYIYINNALPTQVGLFSISLMKIIIIKRKFDYNLLPSILVSIIASYIRCRSGSWRIGNTTDTREKI